LIHAIYVYFVTLAIFILYINPYFAGCFMGTDVERIALGAIRLRAKWWLTLIPIEAYLPVAAG
jgi:hypothetical protein